MVRFLTPKATTCIVALIVSLGSSAAWAADPFSTGKQVFNAQCSICHSNARNGPVILGPPLYGVIGRKAGSVNGFAYSSAMKSAGFVWTPDRLRAYLPGPRNYLPGVKMTYAGLKNQTQLDALIAYLDSLK